MRFKPPLITIPAETPFENDLLGRKRCADALTNLITSSDDGLVLCVNAAWGSGKTTFLSMWRQQLKNTGFKTLMFNAWESDYVDDAMVALLGELELGVTELRVPTEDGRLIPQQHIDTLKRIGGTLIRKGLPLAVRLGTGGILDYDAATEKLIADEAGKYAEEQIKAYEKAKQSIKAFRATLEALAKELSDGGADKEYRPLILFIDELDRCRPPFAIRILEIVKHFFAVPGIVFVLSMDREQLGHSIRSQYGEQMDVTGYLRRFFDVEFNLPAGTVEQFTNAQFERFGLNEVFKGRKDQLGHDEREEISSIFVELFKVMGCSARDQERCFSLISLVLFTANRRYHMHVGALAPLIVLRVKEPELYRGFVGGSVPPKDVLAKMCSTELGRRFLDTSPGVGVELSLRALAFQNRQNAFLEQIQDEMKAIPQHSPRAQSIAEVLSWIDHGYLSNMFGNLSGIDTQINLVENFSKS